MENRELLKDLLVLRDLIWGYDIMHPTIPEYIEWHKKIQHILEEFDKILDKLDM